MLGKESCKVGMVVGVRGVLAGVVSVTYQGSRLTGVAGLWG